MPAHDSGLSRPKLLAGPCWLGVSALIANPETNVAIINGCAYFKSDATIRVLADLPRWSWSRILLLLPRGARDWAYDRIARNRYRLFGRNESCLVPTSSIAARFLLDDPSAEQP